MTRRHLMLWRATEECSDPLGGHVFDYGAHNASIDNPYKCFSCDVALIPVVPVEPDYEAAEAQKEHTPNDVKRIVDAALKEGT